ncbi:hypothetical protein NTE_03002 [Candidatus Nitrososphaera evergladensis SR1]|uniref:Uncharacterized protein n=1 Tax=Candidatus Nitrososphaera evergladensis SR1 TaxID=1459636 RepID=A0A075MWL1_9ARCH|nr:hypothetical protein [Candidatus Nitrososphaera evergladensis]AIF85037.1 hypothetical protein NTE_03002 [Candidatus Nitrososphaera evergladensis SR1]
MALLDSEGMQLVIEMAIASAAGMIGLWYLKKRTKDRSSSPLPPPSSSSSSAAQKNTDDDKKPPAPQ